MAKLVEKDGNNLQIFSVAVPLDMVTDYMDYITGGVSISSAQPSCWAVALVSLTEAGTLHRLQSRWISERCATRFLLLPFKKGIAAIITRQLLQVMADTYSSVEEMKADFDLVISNCRKVRFARLTSATILTHQTSAAAPCSTFLTVAVSFLQVQYNRPGSGDPYLEAGTALVRTFSPPSCFRHSQDAQLPSLNHVLDCLSGPVILMRCIQCIMQEEFGNELFSAAMDRSEAPTKKRTRRRC